VADYSISISNSLNLFGPAPSDLWNAYAWNAFLWGEGTEDLQVIVTKVIENTSGVILDSSVSISLSIYLSISNSLTPESDMYSERLYSGGWSYVFASNTTDGESRYIPSYASGSAQSTTWTSAAVTATSWS
jgi:hypothetical protein